MGDRGRRAAADMVVAGADLLPTVESRLACPVHLSDAVRAVWQQVIDDQPANAFTETHAPLLELYCRHVVQARQLAEQIEAFDPEWVAQDGGIARLDKLLAMHEREGRAASSLATRLRITRQATAHPDTVGRAHGKVARSPRPWEIAAR